MPAPKKTVEIEILRDGVFVAEDVRKDKGETAKVSLELAQIFIERGHAKPA